MNEIGLIFLIISTLLFPYFYVYNPDINFLNIMQSNPISKLASLNILLCIFTKRWKMLVIMIVCVIIMNYYKTHESHPVITSPLVPLNSPSSVLSSSPASSILEIEIPTVSP